MRHLSPDAFVDLLDGTTPETEVPHLRECARCRATLEELRATWLAAADVEVPEPSPLFWDHLSRRVHDGVAAEPAPRAPWWRIDWSWRPIELAGAALATLALVLFVQAPRRSPSTPAAPETAAVVGAPSAGAEPMVSLPDDESIDLMVDLAGDLDWDAAAEIGLAMQGGTDLAVAHLTPGEQAELQRLLSEVVGTM